MGFVSGTEGLMNGLWASFVHLNTLWIKIFQCAVERGPKMGLGSTRVDA